MKFFRMTNWELTPEEVLALFNQENQPGEWARKNFLALGEFEDI